MKNILGIIFTIAICITCIAQQSKNQKKDSVWDKITNDVCICYNQNSDKSEDDIDKLMLRECLEESTEKNVQEITKYYNVKSYKEINLKKYFDEVRPKIAEKCKLSKLFIDESFKTISYEQ